MQDLLEDMFKSYEKHPYKSEKTMRAAMTRDVRTKSRVVVHNLADWDPRKNDLYGVDDGTMRKFKVPPRKAPAPPPQPAPPAPPVPPSEPPAPALPPPRVKNVLPLTVLPTASYAEVEDLERKSRLDMKHFTIPAYLEYNRNYDAVQEYVYNYKDYQNAVRRNLLPQAPFSFQASVSPQDWEGKLSEDEAVQLAARLNGLILARPLPHAVTAYRGTMDIPMFDYRRNARYMSTLLRTQMEVGNSFASSGFTSVTLSPSYAALIAAGGTVEKWEQALKVNGKEYTSLGFLIQYELPAGFPALYVSGSADANEFELILPYEIPVKGKRPSQPFWFVKRKDRVRIRVTLPEYELATTLKEVDDKKKFDKHIYVTIDRVVVHPWERSAVKF